MTTPVLMKSQSMTRRIRPSLLAAVLATIFCFAPSFSDAADFQLNPGDHVSYIGNTLADRMQHHAWLETYIHALFPKHELTFRNLGFSADEIKTRTRSNNFGSPDQWLAKNKSDVVFCFFGYNEALRGEDGLAGFRNDLAGMLDGMRDQKYNGKSAPRLVIFSPIAHENLESPHLPDGSENNASLEVYTEAMAKVCAAKNVRFVDLFTPTKRLYASASRSLTLNGIHLLDHGNQAVARVVMKDLFSNGASVTGNDAAVAKLREAVLDKNYHWFSRYRVVDGYNVYGGRSKLSWFGQSNADVMRREMEMFDVMTANRDVHVWAAAQGKEHKVVDNNLPKNLVVKTNKPGPLEGKFHPYLGGKEAIGKMSIAEGMRVNLFASEEMFPELINPVQMAVDTNGRLFASVWGTYPHWNPSEPSTDRIICLPDDNGDGVADKCITFAGNLNSITGFEFWGGGMLVAAAPEIWFLQDTDGDYVADKKIRMLQGVSSADTHHSANAMVMGPDGWLYWSRGIFNIAPMETPTRTHRTGASGVHRFNPRTFEAEFHFPIGPNPHGDVFDQWGYQFVNDGTGGTGSYVNIGKGRGNRQWFRKRVRPVAATGILSSTHFPERNQGNFLICNTIGVRAVLQHKVTHDGADIRATEIEPIIQSADPNFRPTDVEVGGDGALYVSDWCNVLIGHMQHNMRDPNRDHKHGRIYRVTVKGRETHEPRKLKGQPIEVVLRSFWSRTSSDRYRARLELSGRKRGDILSALAGFTAEISPEKADDAQALLECLWVYEEFRAPNLALVKKVFQAKEPRVRAAATRTLGHWGPGVFRTPGFITDGWEGVLVAASRDPSPLVRAEALKAAVEYEGTASADVIFEVATRPTDSELESVLNYARQNINVDAMIADAVKSGKKLSPVAQAYALKKASPSALMSMERSDAVYNALLTREGVPAKFRREAIDALAKKNNRSAGDELLASIAEAEKNERATLGDLAALLASATGKRLAVTEPDLESLASKTQSALVRSAAYTAWLREGSPKNVWKHALRSRESLTDLLFSVEKSGDERTRAELFSLVRPLQFELPEHLRSPDDDNPTASRGPAIELAYYEPRPGNASIEAFDRAKPRFTTKLENFVTHAPRGRKDAFGTKQTASIRIPKSGKYRFFTASDDGSRLYIDKKQVVENDGNHGIVERSGSVQLSEGLHEIVVTYYDNGGADGLSVYWQGPGIRKQKVPTHALRPAGSGSLRALAIEIVSELPGRIDEKVSDYSKLVESKSLKRAALVALAKVPPRQVSERLSGDDASRVVNEVILQGEEATPVERQSEGYSRRLALGEALLGKLEGERRSASSKLRALRESIPVTADPAVMALGKEVFHRESHCKTCHQPNGQGLPNLYPPLDGSVWVTGSQDRIIRIVIDGMHGNIRVNGKTFSSPPLPPMTGFRHLLSDEEIAAVLTYVRNSWSNRAKPVTTSKVASVRAEKRDADSTFWDAADLLAKYPLEDGSKPLPSVASADGWVPTFVKAWKPSDFRPADVAKGKRSFDEGKLGFQHLGCARCHKMGGEGGVFGPDLAKLDAKKRNAAHVLRSLLQPSKVIEEKFSLYSFVLNDGSVVSGIIHSEKKGQLEIVSDPLAGPKTVKRSAILQQSKMDLSIMPEGQVNSLTREQVLDLVAFVIAGGDAKHKIFGGK